MGHVIVAYSHELVYMYKRFSLMIKPEAHIDAAVVLSFYAITHTQRMRRRNGLQYIVEENVVTILHTSSTLATLSIESNNNGIKMNGRPWVESRWSFW